MPLDDATRVQIGVKCIDELNIVKHQNTTNMKRRKKHDKDEERLGVVGEKLSDQIDDLSKAVMSEFTARAMGASPQKRKEANDKVKQLFQDVEQSKKTFNKLAKRVKSRKKNR